MKQEEVFKKIGGILKELSDQYEYLETVTGKLNDLELELFVSNAHFLADRVEILYKLNLQTSDNSKSGEKPETKERKYFEPVVQQVRHENEPGESSVSLEDEKIPEMEITNFRPDFDTPVSDVDLSSETLNEPVSFIREEPETIRHELILDDSQNWEDDEDVNPESEILDDSEIDDDHIPKTEEQPVTSVTDNSSVTTGNNEASDAKEKAGEDVFTINQRISAQLGDKALGRTEQLNGLPISDIKQAITLNDKLLYVKDLFNGYSLAYTEAIEILNRFTTFEEAGRFLNTNYVTKNNWESKPETTEKFYALLRRRYA